MAEETRDISGGKQKLRNFIANFKGDKVIWMIVLLLILLSLVSIFSSSSGLAVKETTRFDIFFDQLKLAAAGLVVIILCYNIPNIGIIKALSSLGFIVSMVLLICLVGGLGKEVNGAVRFIEIGGMQIYVFEIIKVAMVMYLAWAMHTYKNGGFRLAKIISTAWKRMDFMEKPWAQRLFFIYLPVLIVCGMMFKGGISSTLFCGLIMFLTLLIGGMPKRELFGVLLAGILVVSLFVGIYFASGGEAFGRVGTAINRLTLHKEYEVIQTAPPNSKDYRDAMDKIRQPEGAKLAVKEGGLLGKGPGNSTQKYSVYAIFSDYMYSFIIEEYGLVGGILVLMLYVSLLARGALLVRFCGSLFAKTAVAGLVLLISGQALMHMFINVNIGPLTGQTLPMVSHGSSSFLSFSVAFGILLSISRLAKKQMEQVAKMKAEAAAAAAAAEAAEETEEIDTEEVIEENNIETGTYETDEQ